MNFSNEKAKKSIAYVLGATDGCGVLLGNLFITAGHLLKNGPIDVKIEDRIYRLGKDTDLTKLDIRENEKDIWVTCKTLCLKITYNFFHKKDQY